jgi:hypothetical protein
MSQSSEQRLKRLRDLLDQLERLPPSAEQQRMLREVRARVVDVDTGESPRAMLPIDPDSMVEPGAGAPAPRAPKRIPLPPPDQRRRPRTVTVPKPPAPVRAASREALPRASAEVAREGPPLGEFLSLDDAPTATGPWRRGLRG